MRIALGTALSCAIALALSGCATEGVGRGAVEPTASSEIAPGTPVRFSWQSDGVSAARGTISATIRGHGVFRGKYVQITSQTQDVDMNPYLGGGWHPGWHSWDGWGPGWGGDTFITHYTGKVVAILSSDDGDERMRCRFRLAEPSAGPAGGGIGECELDNGDMVTGVILEGR
jgi:hypothetical protein